MSSIEPLKLYWQGLSSFDAVLKYQVEKVKAVIEGNSPSCIIACEHPTVITLGKRSQNFNDLLIPLKELREKNIEIFSIDRGGHATMHNPGQLVIYPIISLRQYGLNVRQFVELLEVTTAHFLAEYGLEVTRSVEPGLWVDDKKIAAFGIRIDRGVSYHGLAINVFNDLDPFKSIRLCGAMTKTTNMENEMLEFMPQLPQFFLEDMANHWLKVFHENLGVGASTLTRTGDLVDVDHAL